MLGITLVRKLLGLTGEEFGKKFDVSKATVSFWDKGKLTEVKASDISNEYGIPKEMLTKELTPAEQMEIQTKIYKYMVKMNLAEADEQTYDELTANAYATRCEEISSQIATDSELLDDIERLSSIYNLKNGQATINILLAAAERYLQMNENFGKLKVGKTDYKRNLMYTDDQIISIIVSALSLALNETKK